MNWNNDKLNEIQQIEYNLINSVNCGSNSKLFTSFIHSTSEWIDRECNAKQIHVSPYKTELYKKVELVAYNIECGNQVNRAIEMIGTNASKFRKQLTDTHKLIIQAARKQRKINQLKNGIIKH